MTSRISKKIKLSLQLHLLMQNLQRKTTPKPLASLTSTRKIGTDKNKPSPNKPMDQKKTLTKSYTSNKNEINKKISNKSTKEELKDDSVEEVNDKKLFKKVDKKIESKAKNQRNTVGGEKMNKTVKDKNVKDGKLNKTIENKSTNKVSAVVNSKTASKIKKVIKSNQILRGQDNETNRDDELENGENNTMPNELNMKTPVEKDKDMSTLEQHILNTQITEDMITTNRPDLNIEN